MDIKVNIDAEAMQAQLVKAIAESAIGAHIEKAINEALTRGQGYGGKTLVQQAVEGAVFDIIRTIASQEVGKRREEIAAVISEKLTTEALEKLSFSLWDSAVERASRS